MKRRRRKGSSHLPDAQSVVLFICHNSFCKGVKQYGDSAEELCMNLYYFFKNNLCRREDLFEIEETLDLEELVLLCHTQCRWLSLIPALQRLTKVKGAVKKLINDIRRNAGCQVSYFFLLFGSFGNEPMQSCSVCCVSLSLSLYSPPSDRFDHRSFIFYKYMQLCS